MKKLFALCWSMMLLCIMTTACSDDKDKDLVESVYLYTTSIETNASAGSQSVTVSATSNWTATPDNDWITVDIAGGEKGFTAVIVNWTENTTGEERIGSVTFKSGSYTEAIVITQAK